VVIIYTAQWSLNAPPNFTFTNSTFCPHIVCVCFVWHYWFGNRKTENIPLKDKLCHTSITVTSHGKTKHTEILSGICWRAINKIIEWPSPYVTLAGEHSVGEMSGGVFSYVAALVGVGWGGVDVMVCTPARVRCRLQAENKRLATGRPHRTVHSYILRDAALLCQVGAIVPCYCGDHVAAITEGIVQSVPYMVEILGRASWRENTTWKPRSRWQDNIKPSRAESFLKRSYVLR